MSRQPTWRASTRHRPSSPDEPEGQGADPRRRRPPPRWPRPPRRRVRRPARCARRCGGSGRRRAGRTRPRGGPPRHTPRGWSSAAPVVRGGRRPSPRRAPGRCARPTARGRAGRRGGWDARPKSCRRSSRRSRRRVRPGHSARAASSSGVQGLGLDEHRRAGARGAGTIRSGVRRGARGGRRRSSRGLHGARGPGACAAPDRAGCRSGSGPITVRLAAYHAWPGGGDLGVGGARTELAADEVPQRVAAVHDLAGVLARPRRRRPQVGPGLRTDKGATGVHPGPVAGGASTRAVVRGGPVLTAGAAPPPGPNPGDGQGRTWCGRPGWVRRRGRCREPVRRPTAAPTRAAATRRVNAGASTCAVPRAASPTLPGRWASSAARLPVTSHRHRASASTVASRVTASSRAGGPRPDDLTPLGPRCVDQQPGTSTPGRRRSRW